MNNEETKLSPGESMISFDRISFCRTLDKVEVVLGMGDVDIIKFERAFPDMIGHTISLVGLQGKVKAKILNM